MLAAHQGNVTPNLRVKRCQRRSGAHVLEERLDFRANRASIQGSVSVRLARSRPPLTRDPLAGRGTTTEVCQRRPVLPRHRDLHGIGQLSSLGE